jgi:hypothetical protein
LLTSNNITGGTFADPATKYPEYFDYELFRTFPYFLPCLMSAIFAAIGGLLAYFFLEEVRHLQLSTVILN